MDDLTKCLYEFVWAKRIGALAADAEYQEIGQNVEQQTERLAAHLSKEQQRELRTLIDSIAAQDSVVNEHLFQAALSLSGELRDLIRG